MVRIRVVSATKGVLEVRTYLFLIGSFLSRILLLFMWLGKLLVSATNLLMPGIYGGCFATLVIFACPITCHSLVCEFNSVCIDKIREK